jgi:hypothetical protein
MKAFKTYLMGIKRATSEGKLVCLLWLFNVLFAILLYFPFSSFLNRVLSPSATSENFLKAFDMNTFMELIAHHTKEIDTILFFGYLLLIGYIFASVFFDGGILALLVHPRHTGEKRRVAPLFFEGGGKFYGRFFRLLVYSLILWLAIIIAMVILENILKLVTKGTTNEVLIFYMILVRVSIALILVFLVKMILDYARIKIVLEDSRQVFLSLFQAGGFVFRHLWSTLVIYYLYVLTAAIIFVIYSYAHKAINTHSLLPILLAFIIGQVFILSRGWIKVGLQAAQMDYFRGIER